MKSVNCSVWVSALSLLCAAVCQAQAPTNECVSGNTTTTYYVNGVWNTKLQAENSRVLLEKAYKQGLEEDYPEQSFTFVLAYNYHAGLVRDLIEVIGQKINETGDPNVTQLTAQQYLTLYLTAKAVEETIPVGSSPVFTAIEEYLVGRITDSVNASAHIQKYQNDLQEGRRVLLIAHSQGNLFANQAIAALETVYGYSIGMIGVASPAATIHSFSTYYTAYDDRVINALRPFANVLPANIDNDPGFFDDPRDFSNHQFAQSYFDLALASRAAIDADVSSNIANLIFPGALLGSGAITITLTWGSEPDVDLHVTEPNGTHVYYANRTGLAGYLDRDDVSSFGPEHYYVSCDTLETGSYAIGVNYYRGSGPETAHVQISTADGNTRNFDQPLLNAIGSAGDNSPISVATMSVTADENGRYSFQVN